MPRLVHFEFTADDMERAAKFYTETFGWKVQKWDGPVEYWLVMTGEEGTPGIDGGLMKRSPEMSGVYNTIDVPDCDEYIKKIQENGGEIVAPKMAVPGVGWMAYFKDTEGNVSGIMQMDADAK